VSVRNLLRVKLGMKIMPLEVTHFDTNQHGGSTNIKGRGGVTGSTAPFKIQGIE